MVKFPSRKVLIYTRTNGVWKCQFLYSLKRSSTAPFNLCQSVKGKKDIAFCIYFHYLISMFFRIFIGFYFCELSAYIICQFLQLGYFLADFKSFYIERILLNFICKIKYISVLIKKRQRKIVTEEEKGYFDFYDIFTAKKKIPTLTVLYFHFFIRRWS